MLSAEPHDAEPEDAPVVTSFVFRVRNVPAALYKAMGGFATNGVNMTKLESYQLEGQFAATQFYADIEGHPSERNVRLALEELEFFTSHLRVLGVYRASPYRAEIARRMDEFQRLNNRAPRGSCGRWPWAAARSRPLDGVPRT